MENGIARSGNSFATPTLDQIASRPVQRDAQTGSAAALDYEPSQSSELSSIAPSSSSASLNTNNMHDGAASMPRDSNATFINSNHSTPLRRDAPASIKQEAPETGHAPSYSHSRASPQAPPTPATTASPPQTQPPAASTSIPLPSFLSEDPLSSDPDSSSDEDSFGEPKPPREPRYSKSTGLPRPRPNYYYDAEYDPGTAGTKKRGRRGGFKGVPVFEPSMQDFEQNGGFYGYVKRIEKYGLRSGIVKVIPPKEWSDSLPSVLPPLRDIRLKEPIEQHMMGSQGLYRVTNVAKARIWNPAQWKESSMLDKFDAPDLVAQQKKGIRSERSTKSTSVATESRKRKAAAAAAAAATGGVKKEGEREADGEFDADEEDDDEGDGATPKKGRRTPAKKRPAKPVLEVDASALPAESPQQPPSTSAPQKKKRLTNLQKAEPTEEEWQAFSAKFEELPHGMKKADYTVEMMRDFERRYWRTLTFGEAPMYGADMAGSLFNDSTTAWNVAHLGDLLPKLAPQACSIPGVVSPYLYFGMWRATFAWHVEDADLYSINYIHFGAPKFWYSVPQEQADKFERVMEGYFPTDRAKCSQFLRHKAFLASPRVLSNNGITLNRCAQLPGEFILTYPKGYHSGFNLGYNCAESINFATERWIPLGKVAKSCHCIDDSVSIDVNIWLREAARAEAIAKGEPWPYDPPEVDSYPEAPPPQRKRMVSTSDAAPRKRPKPAAQSLLSMYETGGTANLTAPQKAQLAQYMQQSAMAAGLTSLTLAQQATLEQQYLRLLAEHHQQQLQQRQQMKLAAKAQTSASSTLAPAPAPPKPDFVCALCPDLNTEGLVAIGEVGVKPKKQQQAHRLCVMFTPATWIELDAETGKEMVRGFGAIEKARWKLKCVLCSELHGIKVQCTKGKCAKAFHVSCALVEGSGILLDATLPEVGGGEVSVLAQTKAVDAPPSPSKSVDAVPAEAEPMPQIEPEGQLKLTVLCRAHNPDWKLQEQARKAAEFQAKLDALKKGDRIRVKFANGSSYDVFFVSNSPDKESVNIAHEDGATGIAKWKNIIWPESDEVRRKREEAAYKAQEQKAAALDRAAYRENAKKRAPQDPSASPMVVSRSGSHYSPAPLQPYPQSQPYYSGYPSPAPSYNQAAYPHPNSQPTHYPYNQQAPYGGHYQYQIPMHQGYPSHGYASPQMPYGPDPRHYAPPPGSQPYAQQMYAAMPAQGPPARPAPSGQPSHSFSHLLNSQPSSRPQSPFTNPSNQ
ncbi:uncharacterized protein JCM15063_001094 [Sporobolomyces koalae]|uniref:uncharacterized protein n=1 Tax=Sporobolomyces koalae TaxID=500713 RepID=UPI0031796D3D